MRIGVLSDTHIPARAQALPAALFDVFSAVNMILHAGDLVEEWVLLELSTIAPVEAVVGNMDSFQLCRRLPKKKILSLNNFHIGLIHGHTNDDFDRSKTPQKALAAFAGTGTDCVIFGHTHWPYNYSEGRVLLFNPGSPTDPRGEARPSCGLLTIEDRIDSQIIYL